MRHTVLRFFPRRVSAFALLAGFSIVAALTGTGALVGAAEDTDSCTVTIVDGEVVVSASVDGAKRIVFRHRDRWRGTVRSADAVWTATLDDLDGWVARARFGTGGGPSRDISCVHQSTGFAVSSGPVCVRFDEAGSTRIESVGFDGSMNLRSTSWITTLDGNGRWIGPSIDGDLMIRHRLDGLHDIDCLGADAAVERFDDANLVAPADAPVPANASHNTGQSRVDRTVRDLAIIRTSAGTGVMVAVPETLVDLRVTPDASHVYGWSPTQREWIEVDLETAEVRAVHAPEPEVVVAPQPGPEPQPEEIVVPPAEPPAPAPVPEPEPAPEPAPAPEPEPAPAPAPEPEPAPAPAPEPAPEPAPAPAPAPAPEPAPTPAPQAATTIPVYDTAWQMMARATPAQTDRYFAALEQHGFTGTWAAVLHHAPATLVDNFAGGGRLGSVQNGNVVLNADYAARIRAILDTAHRHGQKVGLVVAWQNTYLPGGATESGHRAQVHGSIHTGNARAYGWHMVEQFGDHPALSMWVYGGDAGHNNTDANKAVWREMAAGMRAAGNQTTISYHTPTSAGEHGTFRHLNYAGEPWLDIIAPETGHQQPASETERELRLANQVYDIPVWAGEPRYFNITFDWINPTFRNPGVTEMVADAQAAKRAGVAGYVYGDAGRWNWCLFGVAGDATPCDPNRIEASFGTAERAVIDVFRR